MLSVSFFKVYGGQDFYSYFLFLFFIFIFGGVTIKALSS